MDNELRRVLVKGGVLSPSELKHIISLVEETGLDYFHLGSRQDILFPNIEGKEAVYQKFSNLNIEELYKTKYQNIVCSYVAADIFPSTAWLTGTSYLYILEQFQYFPTLEINITDPQQRLVPLFTGHLNFIASGHKDYWYLFLRLPEWEKVHYYPVLIYTWDIVAVAKCIEDHYHEMEDVESLFTFVSNHTDTNNRTIDKELAVPFYPFPYYEGMNKMGVDQYWLGLYWRNNRYKLSFLKAMCDLCLECKIGKVCITPWKSIIVKGISAKHKLTWEKFLGKKGINVRHSSLELNWHLPVNDAEALELKRFLVRNFDQNDISTYGLTFGISSHYGQNFTAILIIKNPQPKVIEQFNIRPTFNVLYSKDFDPNTREYRTYAQDVDKIELPGLLMELSQLYFDQLGQSPQQEKTLKREATEANVKVDAYQCQSCLTIYDSKYGDSFAGIPAGTPFEQLPNDYVCPTCEAPLSSYAKQSTLQLT